MPQSHSSGALPPHGSEPLAQFSPALPLAGFCFSISYLRKLERGWEELWPPLLLLPAVPEDPPPIPVDCRFPDKSFSTAARFPVRAASRSSCSFPISNREGRGRERDFKREQIPLRSYKAKAVPLLNRNEGKPNASIHSWLRFPSCAVLRDSHTLLLRLRGKFLSAPRPDKLPSTVSDTSLPRNNHLDMTSFCDNFA